MAVAVMPAGWMGFAEDQVTTKAGSLGSAVGTNVLLPVQGIEPRNPVNQSYLATVNRSMGLVNKVAGKKTPSFAIPAVPAKSTWFTSLGLNQRIGGLNTYLDANYQTSEYAVGIHNGDSMRVYLGCHYSMIGLGQAAVGGTINVSMGGIALQGDAANSNVASGIGSVFAAFGTTPTTDTGNAYDITNCVFTGVDDVFSWELMLMRPHDYQMEADGTLYGAIVNAGQPGGTFSYVTTPKAAAVISTTVTMNIGALTGGTGVQILLYLNLDEGMESVGPRRGTKRYTYTLGDFAAANSGNVGYPWLITAPA